MKKSILSLLLISAATITTTLFTATTLQAQNKQLDSTVYDTWRTCESLTISDDASWSFAEYKNKKDGTILSIKIDGLRYKKEISGGKGAEFFNNQNSAIFFVKDTLYCISKINGRIDTIGIVKKTIINEKSDFTSYFRGKTLYIKNMSNNVSDSVTSAKSSYFINPDQLVVLRSQKDTTAIISLNLKGKKGIEKTRLFETTKFIDDFSFDKKGNKLVFFISQDSLYKGTEALMVDVRSKGVTKLSLNDSILPSNMVLNVKKGISFSSDEKYLKFEISPKKAILDKPKEKVAKPAFEFELWRWNDTLIPIQKKDDIKVYAKSLKCVFYPETKKFVQLAYGSGVFIQPDDESEFGFEFNDNPYQYTAAWEDPTPKDMICVNRKTGERKIFLKKFVGTFSISPKTPHVFIYDPVKESWFIVDINTLDRTEISDLMPYPVKDQDYDQPNLAGSYGQAGLSLDRKYFIVSDQYDVWALPTSGIGEPVCITNGYGRKSNIRFKILKTEEKSAKSDGINLKSEIFLESVNLDNRKAGYYKVEIGKDPVKLIEDDCKFTFVKKLGKDYFVVRKESFRESPDYWLTDKNFQLVKRLTDLNDQHKGYAFGDSRIINWKDSSGKQQTGVLYTPEGYDPAKRYPVIVYFYETMSQDAFLFYPPAPTTSTINPVMFVSRGYVIFMPDIHYEIGWPGKSCVNSVVSGTEYLIQSGIADPDRIGVEGHSWGGYQVAFLITQTDIFRCACSEAAVTNMTSAYTGIRSKAGTPRMLMYESTQSRIGGNLWEKTENYIQNSPTFFLNQVTTPLLSRHSDGDEAVPYSQGTDLFLGLKRLGKQVWMFNYKGDGHNIKKREIAVDWSRRMDEYFDYYLMDKEKPVWMK